MEESSLDQIRSQNLSSIHHDSFEVKITDLDCSADPHIYSFDASKHEQSAHQENLSPPRTFIPLQPGSGQSQNQAHDSEYLSVKQSMQDMSITRQSIQLRQEQETLQHMIKLVRVEKAQISKQQAVVQQQCELLKLQLAEAHQRERTQNQMSERLQAALRQQIADAQSKLQLMESARVQVDSEHPKVKEILQFHAQQAQEKLHTERDQFHQKIHELERQIQTQKHESQASAREHHTQRQDYEQRLKAMEKQLKRVEQQSEAELRSVREKMQEKIKYLESEIENLRLEEQSDRFGLLNKHIEQATQLNSQINRLSRDNQELSSQLKKVEIQRDLQIEQREHLQKEVELRQEDIYELEQAVQEAQFLMQQVDSSCKEQLFKAQEETDQLKDAYVQLQKKLSAKERQLLKQARSSHRCQSSGRSQKVNDYFSTTTSALRLQDQKSNRSSLIRNHYSSEYSVRDISYTRMCREIEESMQQPEDQSEKVIKLQQMLSHYRSMSKKLEVQLRDLKLKYQQDCERLQNTVHTEKKRRAQLFEEKIDRSNQLLQQVAEKDQQIIILTKKIGQMEQAGMQQVMNRPISQIVSNEGPIYTAIKVGPSNEYLTQKRKSSLLQRTFTHDSFQTEQPSQRREHTIKDPVVKQKLKRVIVKKLIKPQTEMPVLDLDASSPSFVSEGSKTRVPITSTGKKLIHHDLPNHLQSSQSSRNHQRQKQESSEIVNYETQRQEEQKSVETPPAKNEYYQVDEGVLDMQNIFGSSRSTPRGANEEQKGPNLQNSLMSIAKMKFIDNMSNERDRTDSYESTHKQQTANQIKSVRSGSTQQLPRVCSINLQAEQRKRKVQQPNIPPKPVTISRRLQSSTPQKPIQSTRSQQILPKQQNKMTNK